MIKVLIVNINKCDYLNEGLIHYLNNILPEKELDNSLNFINWEDTFKRRLAHAFVFKWISKQLGVNPKSIQLNRESKFGKPYYNNLFFNISYSHDKIALIFSDCERVGIDIEAIPNFNIFDDLKSVFTSEEKKYLKQLKLKECSSESIRLWTEKEAYLKFLGKGITNGLTNFFVPIKQKRKYLKDGYLTFEMLKYHNYWCTFCYSDGNKKDLKNVHFVNCMSIFGWRS